MRVSDSKRVLFVHVPKTGGSTLDAMLDSEVPDARKVVGATRHESLGSLRAAEPHLADYWSCGFVRNPWARMVSWWSMAARFADDLEAGAKGPRRKIARVPRIWAPLVRYSATFELFVTLGTEKVERLTVPQVEILSDGDERVDFIGRMENFIPDVNVLRAKLGLDPVESLPRKNPSTHGHYSEYYTDETRELVAHYYAADIEAFGYTFEQR